MAPIIVWKFNEVLDIWDLKKTNDKLETFAEEKYFRVLRDTGKYRHLEKQFYYSLEDYLRHVGKTKEFVFLKEKDNVRKPLEETIG